MRRSGVFLLLLLFSVGLAVSRYSVTACVDQPGFFENETIFFQSSLAADSVFARFYYDARHDRRQYQWDEDILTTRSANNLKEWEKWFGGTLLPDDIRQLVYQVPLSVLENLAKSQAGQPWKAVLLRQEHQPALEYLLFAKRCEPYCVVDRWSWDVEAEIAERRKPADMLRLVEEAKRHYEKAASPFFKLRYGYQMVRLAHYANDYQRCIDLFNRYIAPLSKASVVWDWAARHRNGALLALGKASEALLMSSLMFDQSLAMMDEAYLDFYIPEEPVWQESLRLAGHPHRQATLWMLRGLKEPRLILEPLQQMARLEPKSSRVEVMLVRYINRLECEFLNSGYFFDVHEPHLAEEKARGLGYIRELLDYIDAVDKMQFRQPALWYAAGGYLNIIIRNYREAGHYLARAESLCPPQRIDLRNQIQLLKLLNQVIEQPQITAEIENNSLSVLQWLDGYKEQSNNRAEIHHAFYTLLGQKYLLNKDFPKAYCTMAKAGTEHDYLLELYPTSAQMDQLLALLGKMNKTPFEQRITTGLPWSLNDYLSVEGTRLLRKGRYSEALARFQQISKAYWNQLRKEDLDLVETSFAQNYYNPRTGLYQYPKNGFRRFTKLEFTQKVIELQRLAEKDRANAGYYYYQIANGFFHSPFWGFNEQLWPYSSSVWLYGSDYPFDVQGVGAVLKQRYAVFNEEYGKRKVALAYYVKAMNATNDPELAAQCCFLAAACMTEFSFYRSFQEPGRGMAYYFEMLRQKYSRTSYYQKVIRECATFRDYLKKH